MYNYFKIIEKLQNAYGASTKADNKFAKALQSIKWDAQFQADGETYFVKGELTITAQSTNPFTQQWKPCWMLGGTLKEF